MIENYTQRESISYSHHPRGNLGSVLVSFPHTVILGKSYWGAVRLGVKELR